MAGVLLEPTTVAGTPGGTATCSVKIRNTGAVVDAFTVSVLGDAAAWATVIPAQLSLFPGSDGTVEILFNVPRASSPPAGPIDFGVRVAASEDVEGSVVEEGVLELAPFSEFNAKLTPRTSEGKRSAKHEVLIDNRGNSPVDISLAASDPDEMLAFEVRPPSLTIGPGESGRAAIKVIAAKGTGKGGEKHRPFEVMVTGGPMDLPVRLDGNMVQKGGMPRFILPLVGLAVAAAVLIMVLPALLSKKDDSGTLRLTNETPTTVAAGDDEAAAAAQAAKDQAEAEAAAAAEKAANGKDPGSATGGGTATGSATAAAGTGAAAATGGATATGSASTGGGTSTGGSNSGGTTESTTPNAAPPPPPGATTTAAPTTTVPPAVSKFVGNWPNANASTTRYKRMNIRADSASQKLLIQEYGSCGGSECFTGEFSTPYSDANDGTLSLFLTFSFKTESQQFTIQGTQLRVVGHVHFTDGRGPDQDYTEFFNRA